MLKIGVCCVGKLKEPHWKEAQEEFLRRLSQYARVEVIEVAAEATGATVTGTQSMSAEAERLLKRLPDDAFVIALERTGKELSSLELAELIRTEGAPGREIAFVIGGAEGLDASVLTRANRKVSMSRLTLTHEMARVFLLEQVYRAGTIIAGKTYHR